MAVGDFISPPAKELTDTSNSTRELLIRPPAGQAYLLIEANWVIDNAGTGEGVQLQQGSDSSGTLQWVQAGETLDFLFGEGLNPTRVSNSGWSGRFSNMQVLVTRAKPVRFWLQIQGALGEGAKARVSYTLLEVGLSAAAGGSTGQFVEVLYRPSTGQVLTPPTILSTTTATWDGLRPPAGQAWMLMRTAWRASVPRGGGAQLIRVQGTTELPGDLLYGGLNGIAARYQRQGFVDNQRLILTNTDYLRLKRVGASEPGINQLDFTLIDVSTVALNTT